MSIRIDSEESLMRVADYCHDAVFDADKISYDKGNMIFSLAVTREMWEKAEKERSVLFFHRFKVPKIESVLALYDVVDADIRTCDIQDVLVDIRYDDAEKMVSLKCTKGTQVHLKVEGLRGLLEDTGERYFDGTRFTTLSLGA